MAIVTDSKSPLLPRLRGMHLFGFDGAPCSQRVSFVLAEKGLRRARTVRWNSTANADCDAAPGTYVFRPVSLVRKEHLSPEYAMLQPNMVVPALVHEGVLHNESMDIIDYLEERWPAPRLLPEAPDALALTHELIKLGKELHVSVRYVSFHWGLGRLGRIGKQHEKIIGDLERKNSPERLLDFYRRYNDNAIDEATFLTHLRALEASWGAQEQRLRSDNRPFLTGGQFTRADVMWAIKVLRIYECGYPFANNFPALHAWYQRVSARPGFQQGVLAPHRAMHRAFRVKATIERWLGGGIAKVAAA